MRRILSFLLKAAVSVLLLYFVLNRVNPGTVAGRLSRISPVWIVVELLVMLVQIFFLAVRWRQIVLQCGGCLSLGLMFRFSLIAMFFNQTLPSSVGGDAMRIWLVAKRTDWRAAIYSVVLDRLVGVVVLATLVLVCLPWTFALVHDPVGRSVLLLIGFGSLAAGLAFVFLSWSRLRILRRWSLTHHLADMATVAAKILQSHALMPIAVASILIHLLTSLAAWAAARSVNADLPLLYSLFLVLPVILVTVVPISIAGWGVREGAMVATFAYAGLPQSDGLIVSLLYGFGYLVLGALGGVIWILSPDSRKQLASPAVRRTIAESN